MDFIKATIFLGGIVVFQFLMVLFTVWFVARYVKKIGPPLKVKKLSENAVLPSRATPGSSGYDLYSAREMTVPAGGKALVPTDLSMAVPDDDTDILIASRSGLALNHSIFAVGGVIDKDYRGPVGVILFNISDVDFEIKLGDRIAQLIGLGTREMIVVDELDSTVRGAGGFGSTGVKNEGKCL